MRFATRGMIFPDCEQAGVFALRSGIRLRRNGGEPGDFRQPVLQLLAHLDVAGRLIVRRERMELGEFRPRNRKHFRARIQFHRARAERNHRMTQGQVARLEFF